MPVAGRKPKDGPVRHRVKPVHEWQELEAVPYSGPVPPLPRRVRGSWSARTKRWWAVVSAMPHCTLWTEADWQFALDTVSVYEEFVHEPTRNSKALMDREKILGTTLDFRRDLRIRYVEVVNDPVEAPGVALLDDYRQALDDS